MKLKIPMKKIKKTNVESMAKGKKKIAIDENMHDVIPYLRDMGYDKIYKVEKGWKDIEDIHPWLNENKIRFFFTRNIGKRNKNVVNFTTLKRKQYIVYYIQLSAPAYRIAEYIDCLLRKTSTQLLKTLMETHESINYKFNNDKLKLLKC